MASGGGDLKAAFAKFATKNGNTEATTKDMTRWCTDAGVFTKTCNSNHLDICFAKVKTKGKLTITFDKMGPLITEMAKKYKDPATGETQITEKLSSAEPKGHGTTGTSKTGGVSKMTDTSKYTGSHKERFDESGKGKGKDGRTEQANTTGYVGNYKGEGSYDKKK